MEVKGYYIEKVLKVLIIYGLQAPYSRLTVLLWELFWSVSRTAAGYATFSKVAITPNCIMHQNILSRIRMAVCVIIAKLLRQFVIVMITLCLSSPLPLVSVQATGDPGGWLRVFLHRGQDTVIFPGNCETEISPLGTNYTIFMTLINNTTACKVSVSGCIHHHYTFWGYAMRLYLK